MKLLNLIKNLNNTKTHQDLVESNLELLTKYLAQRTQLKTILFIGLDALTNWRILDEEYNYILIDTKTNLSKTSFKGKKLEFKDLLNLQSLENSIIVSKNFFNTTDENYLKQISQISRKVPLFLIVEDARETSNGKYSLNEFESLLNQYEFSPYLSGKFNSYKKDIKNEFIIIGGFLAKPKNVNKDLKVLALLSVYNEKDIIENTIVKLLNNGTNVHVIDNWSTDGSYELVQELSKKFSTLTSERFPDKPNSEYLWDTILKRKQDIANELKYDWYIHCDADEVRESPWKDKNLLEAITCVDSLGFNTIDLTVMDFRPVEDGFNSQTNPLNFFKYFEFGKRPGHFLQIKAWKANPNANLVDEGGHNVSFPNRKVFPLKFLLKHYPLRSLEQAQKKIFVDRLPRVERIMKETGWHTHYKTQSEFEKYIWNKEDLVEFNNEFYKEFIIERLTGIGII